MPNRPIAVCYSKPVSRQNLENWAEVVDDIARGDRVAFVKLSRLVTGFLTYWRAFDFQDDWDDFVQEVIMATIEGVKKDRIRDPNAIYGYIRSAARFKYIDRIRSKKRRPTDSDPEGLQMDAAAIAKEPSGEFRQGEVWDALGRLPDHQRVAVTHVYAEGLTYEEASSRSGIPLGSLKRYLRQGLAALQVSLTTDGSEVVDSADAK